MPDYRRRFAALVAVDRQPIRAEAPDPKVTDTTATLRLYDPIDSYGGTWGISAKELAAVVDDLPDTITDIRLLVNSPGGEVTEGLAILNVLRAHPAKVTAVVEGIAASSASFIACGVDELVMAPNSEIFVHDAWGLCVGNAKDMQQMANELAHISDNIASIYAEKAGGTVEDWRQTMADETWFSAEQAVAAGLADRIDTGREPAAADAAKARHDLSVFNLAGRKAAEASATPPSPTPHKGQEGASMSDLSKLRDALGLAEDVSDEQIVDWLAAEATAPPAPVADPPAAKLPDGVVAVDKVTLDKLTADAQAGVEARAEQLRQQRENTVNAAVADGRIAPARKDAWLAQLEADPGAETVLASLAKGTIPVAQIGTNGVGDLDADDAIYAEMFGKEATV